MYHEKESYTSSNRKLKTWYQLLSEVSMKLNIVPKTFLNNDFFSFAIAEHKSGYNEKSKYCKNG